MDLKISENTLRAIRFERPDYIPVIFWINPACWHHYPKDTLIQLMGEHPHLFPDFDPIEYQPPALAPWERADSPYTDPWGCVWETSDDGLTGVVTDHPLADWDQLTTFESPDPAQTDGIDRIDWTDIKNSFSQCQERGLYGAGSLEHGFGFLRLTYLRGYENLIFDMTDANSGLTQLIETIETFNLNIVQRYLDLGAVLLQYPEDLGMQTGPMLSPEHFRTYIFPLYKRLMAPAQRAGTVVHMHSDGDIRSLIEDIMKCGIDVLNLQDIVNGIDWIAAHLKGRVCIDLDIDRQQVTRFGTPAQIDALIREEVEMLGSPQGGLMMIYGLYPGVPVENIKALMAALERYAGYYS